MFGDANGRSPRGERCGQPSERDFLCSRGVSQNCASAPQPGRFCSAFKGGRRAGWRRSADRTRLRTNSLQTGNFAGKMANLAAGRHAFWSKTAALQGLPAQFPTPTNRDLFWASRVLSRQFREFIRRQHRLFVSVHFCTLFLWFIDTICSRSRSANEEREMVDENGVCRRPARADCQCEDPGCSRRSRVTIPNAFPSGRRSSGTGGWPQRWASASRPACRFC